ncbi:hypothetical protein HZH66_014865 [Vespula vulgaris]|uniref:Uncharacterized protein n=1 Tax=Vespula vulgaris TaxID=7454 RepID=A0A834J037_VESVU|nr:hypothetical protein HZH66_014865 [Vespula vulgaris]
MREEVLGERAAVGLTHVCSQESPNLGNYHRVVATSPVDFYEAIRGEKKKKPSSVDSKKKRRNERYAK